MLTFVVPFALAQITAALLASALGHLARFTQFRALVREHGLMPRATPVALGVVGFELSAGGAALVWVRPDGLGGCYRFASPELAVEVVERSGPALLALAWAIATLLVV